MDAWIAGGIFLAAYVAIASERVDRTLVALLGGMLVVALGVLNQHDAFAAIDLNVIFLLAGMMVLAGTLGESGIFEWLAHRAVRATRAQPFPLLITLALITAVLSAVLDNVTTVLLIVPVTLTVAARLGVSPYPFLISQVMASNIGGTATLIGDPPNILIGSAAGLGFDAFLANLAPVAVVVLIAYLVIARLAFGTSMTVDRERRLTLLAEEPGELIRDSRLLRVSLVVLAATVIGFLLHTALGLEPATIAMLGATVILLVSGRLPHQAFREIEWSTLLFFVGLFILVESVVQVGIVGAVADRLAQLAGGQPTAAALGLLWFSAVASAVIDNIPYTASAIPVVHRLVADGMPAQGLWWGLALGACLGGNLTIVGASANVVVANLAARAGHPIRFGPFLQHGAVVVIVSLLISSAYLWLRYLG